VVDIRPVELRADGEMPGALVVDRNVLECSIHQPHQLPAYGPDQPVVLV
jgi:hypothetical protein